ncbi:MAG: type II toxin-antitoxin system Phd/YefM family antitoxin [Alphaproteobacteria bacterium]|nr:type II toxin-antitoxin system Phd/YefM family antitoxin [Alphaproteobacteria bacterium]
MLTKSDIWKLQDAKAKFSEVVRRARAGEPQHVTVHGKEAVAVVDTSRFDIVAKAIRSGTMRTFLEESRKYRVDMDFDFDRPLPMDFPEPRLGSKRGKKK